MVKVRFKNNAPQVMDEFERKVTLALGAMGEIVEGYAKDDCPVDTGRLRNSLTYATNIAHDSGTDPATAEDYKMRSTPEKGEVYIGTNVEYGKYVEFDGTKYHVVGKAHFLRDAATTHNDELKNTAKTILKS